MNSLNLKNVLLAATIGAAAVPMAALAGDYEHKDKNAMEKTGDYISDAALTTKINAALMAQGDLSAMDIDVDSKEGVVTLSGRVETDAQVELAEKVVEDLDGVKSVNNKLESKES